jgi:hypothetical protein
MNPTVISAVLAEAGGDALWRTNPVLCIDRLLQLMDQSDAIWGLVGGRVPQIISDLSQHGINLPPEALRRWAARGSIALQPGADVASEHPTPRVIGLAIDGSPDQGYVFPLRPTVAANGWKVDLGLPFTPEQVQDGLAWLLQESGIPSPQAVPERLAFGFENLTKRTARGDSMTVAAVLAVLDQMGGYACPLLRAAVALVELQPGGRIGSVSDIPAKLAVAYRECGELTLVVCLPGVEVARGPRTVVWEVKSLADLAGRLHAAGVLAPLLDSVDPLTKAERDRVLDRLRWLVESEHRYRDAADLGDRVRRCGFAGPPDPTAWVEFAGRHAKAYRHHGCFAEAVSVGCEAHQRVANLGDLGCDDEEADAAAEYAASLFSGHRFAEVLPLLQPWAKRTGCEPRRFRPLTRVKVWNTLARALAILKLGGWEELFSRSLALQRRLEDPENIDRTTHYLIHARLRHGNTTGARAALADAPGLGEQSGAGKPWVAFLHANLARLENRVWVDPALDEQLAAGAPPYSAWVYVQAAARQPSRKREDALRRLDQARSLLKYEAGEVQGNVCNLFAAFLELDAAARWGDSRLWANAVTTARGFLSAAPDHRDYYGPTVDASPEAADVRFAEALLDLVPYF